jgi:predicted glycosyltransferase involved in capsule biosynthesis
MFSEENIQKIKTQNMNVVNVPNITYVIAYKHRPDRLLNLRRVLEWLAPFQGMEIILVEQDKESKIAELNLRLKHIFIKSDLPFNKAWAFNVATRYVKTPVIIFGDSDLIMNPSAFINAANMLNMYDVVNPYNSVIDLTPQESMADINSILQINRIGRGDAEDDIQKVPLCGGIIMFKKEKLIEIGGWNEDFIGWGAEDDFQSLKVKMYLTHTTVPNKCYHLHHEKAKVDMKLYERNLGILNHFANVNKEQMSNHINMTRNKIGVINKYS